MKPPVKDLRRRYISSQFHKELIPRGSVAETFVFYSGQLEFLLTDYERFVMAHTTRPPIHEFWACIQKDARRVYEILTSEIFKFDNENMFQILQETWGSYPNPYVRSALFFLMNTCSEQGLLSFKNLRKAL
jgi:site-specific DNA-adenine methylase